MTVKTMNVIVKSGLLQLILEYALVEDWIFPIINKVVPEMSFFATIEDLDAVLEDDPVLLYHIRLRKLIEEKKFFGNEKKPQHPNNMRLLKLCGILCYKFHRKQTFSNQYFK